MNNINQINNSPQLFINKNKKINADNSTENTFKQTFGNVLKNMESSQTEAMTTQSLKEIAPQDFNMFDPSESLGNRTENLLEMLENYVTKIKDNSTSLKDIDSILKDLQVDAQNLLQEIDNSPKADEEIKNIAKEFALFANLEQIKFQRGDYLS